MITFISCVKSKRSQKSKAKDLYTSPLFVGSLNRAKQLSKEEDIYILSAKYGLVDLEQVIEPYELTLNTMSVREKKVWAYKVYKQLVKKGFTFEEEVTFLAGMNYRKYLMRKFPNKHVPLDKVPMGKQLQYYKRRGLL